MGTITFTSPIPIEKLVDNTENFRKQVLKYFGGAGIGRIIEASKELPTQKNFGISIEQIAVGPREQLPAKVWKDMEGTAQIFSGGFIDSLVWGGNGAECHQRNLCKVVMGEYTYYAQTSAMLVNDTFRWATRFYSRTKGGMSFVGSMRAGETEKPSSLKSLWVLAIRALFLGNIPASSPEVIFVDFLKVFGRERVSALSQKWVDLPYYEEFVCSIVGSEVVPATRRLGAVFKSRHKTAQLLENDIWLDTKIKTLSAAVGPTTWVAEIQFLEQVLRLYGSMNVGPKPPIADFWVLALSQLNDSLGIHPQSSAPPTHSYKRIYKNAET